MKPWSRVEPTKITKVGWRTIATKSFIMPNGNKVAFDTLHADGQEFACVIALTPDYKVIVARQFRPGPEKMMDELPGGFVDHGETLETSARRELLEETGYQASEIRYLGAVHKDTYMNSKWHVFMAFGCTLSGTQHLEEEEAVELKLISIKQLIKNAKADKMTDHGAILLAYDDLKKLEEES